LICLQDVLRFKDSRMPELPEVEVLARHLRAVLHGQTIRRVTVHRPRSIRPTSPASLQRTLRGTRFRDVQRRAKYLLFHLSPPDATAGSLLLLGHLGMTGRIYLLPRSAPTPQHAVVELQLIHHRLVFDDTRYFGRLTLDTTPLRHLGPEPLDPDFTRRKLADALRGSRQPIKTRLLDQSLLAGIGNIYASEALFRARIHPATPACRLSLAEWASLHRALRAVLRRAITVGSTIPLDWSGANRRDRLFYYGRSAGAPESTLENLQVYDRRALPCPRCQTAIRKIAQNGRSTYFCPRCQAR
jgi:formamidopyrimidine-DNA glycosylase